MVVVVAMVMAVHTGHNPHFRLGKPHNNCVKLLKESPEKSFDSFNRILSCLHTNVMFSLDTSLLFEFRTFKLVSLGKQPNQARSPGYASELRVTTLSNQVHPIVLPQNKHSTEWMVESSHLLSLVRMIGQCGQHQGKLSDLFFVSPTIY